MLANYGGILSFVKIACTFGAAMGTCGTFIDKYCKITLVDSTSLTTF
jgi:hypothetical protein